MVSLSSTTRTRRPRSWTGTSNEPVRGAGDPLESGGEREGAARARLAGHPQLAAEGVDQLARDREPEAGAAVAPGRRRVGLGEGLEEPVARRRVDADAGVGDVDAEHHVARGLALDACLDHDLAAGR